LDDEEFKAACKGAIDDKPSDPKMTDDKASGDQGSEYKDDENDADFENIEMPSDGEEEEEALDPE